MSSVQPLDVVYDHSVSSVAPPTSPGVAPAPTAFQARPISSPIPATGATPSNYDLIPYPDLPFAQAHPDRLASVAILRGMTPASVTHCRVLELGCGSGGNIIPMADALPNSRFVGIDLSSRQIHSGQSLASSLNLSNLTLHHADILDLAPDDLGEPFDYIIAHGLYSWVPEPVRDKLLDICRQNLAKSGVAFISYNTLPGWNTRGMLRGIMSYHTRSAADPTRKITEARQIIDFLAASVLPNSPYGTLLHSEANFLRQLPDGYVLHEHLEDINHAVYFHEFIKHAADNGLKYLCEADLRTSSDLALAAPVRQALDQLTSDPLEHQQYLDFLRNRQMRQTLLCHRDTPLAPNFDATRLTDLYISCFVKPDGPIDLHSTAPARFTDIYNITYATPAPLVKAALLALTEVWPDRLTFTDLLDRSLSRLGIPTTAAPEHTPGLMMFILHAALCDTAHLHPRPADFVTTITECPMARPLARIQARSGNQVTNFLHQPANLSPNCRQILPLLDGQHERRRLIDTLRPLIQLNQLAVPELAPDDLSESLPRLVDADLRQLAAAALLLH